MEQSMARIVPLLGAFLEGGRTLNLWVGRERVRSLKRAGKVRVRISFEIELERDGDLRIGGGSSAAFYRMGQRDLVGVGGAVANLAERASSVQVALIENGGGLEQWFPVRLYSKEGIEGADDSDE